MAHLRAAAGAIALALAVSASPAARADTFTYKNMPADKDVVLYQSGDRDVRTRVTLCFWFRAEQGSFKITSEKFREPIELGGADKAEQRVVCGSIITVRAAGAENALQYAVVQ
ncbi:MAG: hypothetical protein IT563_02870 [Alphaproteobacteria bacterium]|nr:hypothetical protein [Alphaproteobacteria bacterium]